MSSASWRTAPRPSSAGLHSFNHTKLVLKYKPAPCGIDSNLLLLLHGLGDTADPFFSLGQRLQQTLPQTAVLSVQAPLRVPLLEEEAWMWYDSFDALGEGTFACPSVPEKSVSCRRMIPGIVSCLLPAAAFLPMPHTRLHAPLVRFFGCFLLTAHSALESGSTTCDERYHPPLDISDCASFTGWMWLGI